MDIIAVHQSVKFAKQWVSAGKGPLLMEYVTYRYGGHSCVSYPAIIIPDWRPNNMI